MQVFKARSDKETVVRVLIIPYLTLFAFAVLLILRTGFNVIAIPIELVIWFFIASVIQLSYHYSIIYLLKFTIEKRVLCVKIGLVIMDSIEIFKIEEISSRRKEYYKFGYSERYISIKGKSFREINISPLEEKEFVNALLEINSNIKNSVK